LLSSKALAERAGNSAGIGTSWDEMLGNRARFLGGFETSAARDQIAGLINWRAISKKSWCSADEIAAWISGSRAVLTSGLGDSRSRRSGKCCGIAGGRDRAWAARTFDAASDGIASLLSRETLAEKAGNSAGISASRDEMLSGWAGFLSRLETGGARYQAACLINWGAISKVPWCGTDKVAGRVGGSWAVLGGCLGMLGCGRCGSSGRTARALGATGNGVTSLLGSKAFAERAGNGTCISAG